MQISEAESVVMELLWQRSPRSAEDVVAELKRLIGELDDGQ
jgi:BlaI family transcriptional regulator, penicillinase repressor